MEDRDRLLAELEEAKLRVSDLMRSLDESPSAGMDDQIAAELDRAEEEVARLERALRPGARADRA